MKKKISGIYKITNLINGKIYIGQSTDINRRFKEHIRHSKYDDTPIHRAIRKYGSKNFSFSILEETNPDRDELNEKEIKYIKQYNSTKKKIGYNVRPGGNLNPHLSGVDNPKSVLTVEIVTEIREYYLKGEVRSTAYKLILSKYPGINRNTFNDVWIGKTYKNIHYDVYDLSNKDSIKKIRSINRSKRFNTPSRKFVEEIRDKKNQGIPKMDVYESYKDTIPFYTFDDIWFNRVYPYIKSKLPDNSNLGKGKRKAKAIIRINPNNPSDFINYRSCDDAIIELFGSKNKNKSNRVRNLCKTKQDNKILFGYYWKFKD